MSAPGSSPNPPDQPARPGACVCCGATDLKAHCGHRACPWSLCLACNNLSGYVLGKIRTMPSMHPEWHKR